MEIFSDILISQHTAAAIAPTVAPAVTAARTQSLGLPPPRANPWQRQGTTLLAEATTDPEAAMRSAGLTWTVERVDLRTADTLEPVPGSVAMRRSDTGRILGVVGDEYEPFQNQAMFDVFRDLAQAGKTGDGLPFTIETAGCFHGGRVVWAMAHLPDLGIRLGEDEAKTYLLVSNGHVGNRTLIIAPTTIRVICQNTLRLAEAQIAGNRERPGLCGGFVLKHTPGIHAAVAEAKAAFATTMAAHQATKSAWAHLASIPLTKRMETEFLAAVFGRPGPDEADRARALRKTREERIAAILASPTSQVRGTKDTAFSLLQAVVEYADHDRPTRTSDGGGAEESRLFSAMFGSGADLKARAWGVALSDWR